MGLLTIKRADTNAVLATETRSTNPSATYNNSTIASSFTGTKTFNCSGLRMKTNLVIGGKTLNCNNTRMPYNVTATYEHVWEKYNCLTTYSDNLEWLYQPEYGESCTYRTGNFIGKYVYCGGTSCTFDSSTGTYTISGAMYSTDPWGWVQIGQYPQSGINMTKSYPYKYASGPVDSTSSPVTEAFETWQYRDVWEYAAWNITSSSLRFYNNDEDADRWGRRRSSTTTYSKGSTDYGAVTSTSSTAYPENGRHSDGYWYVKTY